MDASAINRHDDYVNELRKIKRDGIEELIKWLEDSDFFKAPASTVYHGNVEGYLASHSLMVGLIGEKMYKMHSKKMIDIPPNTFLLVGLLHDLCKVNCYIPDTRNVKNKENSKWEQIPTYKYEEQNFYGHGFASVKIASRFIKLTETEERMIAYHMGHFEVGEKAWYSCIEKFPECLIIHTADLQSMIYEPIIKLW